MLELEVPFRGHRLLNPRVRRNWTEIKKKSFNLTYNYNCNQVSMKYDYMSILSVNSKSNLSMNVDDNDGSS